MMINNAKVRIWKE